MTRPKWQNALFTGWFVALWPLWCTPAAGQEAPRLPLPGPRTVTEILGSLPPGNAEPRLGPGTPARLPQRAELVSLVRIWGRGTHSAFTDLAYFRDRWFCAFREGAERLSPDGVIRLITSADGEHWTPSSVVSFPGADLRDPKLSITSDRRLMLTAAARFPGGETSRFQTLTWFSLDGRDWADPFKIGDPDVWLWRVNWHRGNAYSAGYSTGEQRFLRFYMGPEGMRFQRVSEAIYEEGTPTEATLLFNNDDTSLCLLRRDSGSGTTLLGRSRPPYRSWHWQDLGARLVAPNMIRLPDDRIVAAGRIEDRQARTAVCWLDQEAPALKEILSLPSGGDSSYPGLVWRQGLLWVSYHSSHEGRTAIYLAKVRLPEPE